MSGVSVGLGISAFQSFVDLAYLPVLPGVLVLGGRFVAEDLVAPPDHGEQQVGSGPRFALIVRDERVRVERGALEPVAVRPVVVVDDSPFQFSQSRGSFRTRRLQHRLLVRGRWALHGGGEPSFLGRNQLDAGGIHQSGFWVGVAMVTARGRRQVFFILGFTGTRQRK